MPALIETVNTMGKPRYVKQYEMPNDKGINLDTQMNALNMCTKPSVLQRATTDGTAPMMAMGDDEEGETRGGQQARIGRGAQQPVTEEKERTPSRGR